MALPRGAFLKREQQAESPKRLREGAGWCREGTSRSGASKDAEKFAGIGSDGGDD